MNIAHTPIQFWLRCHLASMKYLPRCFTLTRVADIQITY